MRRSKKNPVRTGPSRDWYPVGLVTQSDWVPVTTGPSPTGCQSRLVPVRLGASHDWSQSHWYPVRLAPVDQLKTGTGASLMIMLPLCMVLLVREESM